jgi:hypothetical protein
MLGALSEPCNVEYRVFVRPELGPDDHKKLRPGTPLFRDTCGDEDPSYDPMCPLITAKTPWDIAKWAGENDDDYDCDEVAQEALKQFQFLGVLGQGRTAIPPPVEDTGQQRLVSVHARGAAPFLPELLPPCTRVGDSVYIILAKQRGEWGVHVVTVPGVDHPGQAPDENATDNYGTPGVSYVDGYGVTIPRAVWFVGRVTYMQERGMEIKARGPHDPQWPHTGIPPMRQRRPPFAATATIGLY